ncbi:MAG: glycosyltransferase [Cyanobacteria bacterium P01_D01_bin.156]
MKIALLHTRLSGYLAACLREFKHQTGAQLLIFAWPNQPDAPFDTSKFADLGKVINRYDCSNGTILKQILEFQPTAILASGWRDKGYAKICRALKSKDIPIIAGCDTQWKGSLKQYFASWVAPLHIQKFIDVLWVTGERQRYLAQALGYTGEQCWEGYYACDWASFANQSIHQNIAYSPYFLYVGRYAPEKGLDTLSVAYKNYVAQVQNPWRLVCAGAGPLNAMLLESGAEDKGFVQPENLPKLMKGASAFVLPSRFEPWGVVAQEAAASGLPLILSDACGAGVSLLHKHYNGFDFSNGSVESLTQALKAMHSLPLQQRQLFGQASYELSKQYTPKRWAETLLQGLQQLDTQST